MIKLRCIDNRNADLLAVGEEYELVEEIAGLYRVNVRNNIYKFFKNRFVKVEPPSKYLIVSTCEGEVNKQITPLYDKCDLQKHMNEAEEEIVAVYKLDIVEFEISHKYTLV